MGSDEVTEFRWAKIADKAELKKFYKRQLPAIREAARKVGYAIGVHGSLARDFDLIAVPWTHTPVDHEELVRVIHRAVCGIESQSYTWETKSPWRVATCFPVCWPEWQSTELSLGHIDLSVILPR